MEKYKIIEAHYDHLFVEMVNKAILEGWTPLGGVTVYKNDLGCIFYAQALIK
ncbi:DUF1737 domain-containing protein [Flavobacterium sp. GCM10023249]|uniref:DUF1737 domain-containing protein n=1 Tax=unclassified Flavobacterium TaxID=196869 RepID=UPI00361F43BA